MSRDITRLKVHVNQVWEILTAYASDNINGHPAQVYSFMRNRNEILGRKMYAALMRVITAPDMARNAVLHSFFASFI